MGQQPAMFMLYLLNSMLVVNTFITGQSRGGMAEIVRSEYVAVRLKFCSLFVGVPLSDTAEQRGTGSPGRGGGWGG